MTQPSGAASETSEVLFAREGAVGVITLNRPEAINALSLAMVEAILARLQDWAEDDAVRAILIEGRGEKGFCAGGDVRAVRETLLAGRTDLAIRFFAAEYDMNRLIATYDKPVIALQTGVVMGGGIGLSSHARYRIATPGARFAMPEAALGFFCDVGVNALLARSARAPALAFMLSGSTIETSDAIVLGLTDLCVPQTALAGLRQRLIGAAEADEIDTAIATVLQSETSVAGEAPFCALADQLSDCFAENEVGGIIEMLDYAAEDGDVGAASLVGQMKAHCPTSLAVILAAHLAARRSRSLAAVLDTDRRLAEAMIQRPDFSEGVRAVLVDKDRAPVWSPDRLHRVDKGAIARWMAQA